MTDEQLKTYAEAMIAEVLDRSMNITLSPKDSLALIKSDVNEIIFMRNHSLQLLSSLIYVLTDAVHCKEITANYEEGNFTVKITI